MHHGMPFPVIYRPDMRSLDKKMPIVNLQCVSGIHFNPVTCVDDDNVTEVNMGNTTCAYDGNSEEIGDGGYRGDDEDAKELSLEGLYQAGVVEECSGCHGSMIADVGCFVEIGSEKLCGIIDTGAQISLIRES